jgi:ABC-type nitrate/sulfonate/bicarbonate transport system substrate-binding protein
VPIKAVATYYQRTPIVLLSPKAKPVTDPKQLLTGLKIGSKRASATYQGLTALLAVNNIDLKRVNLVDIGFGVQPLLVGQVDALMGFTMNEAIEAESAGMPVTELSIADYGVTAYGLTLASNEKLLQSRPELVRGFLRATRRAVEATAADNAAAVQALAAASSEMDAVREAKVLTKSLPFWAARGTTIAAGFGAQSLQGWQQTVETAQRVGLVEKAPAAKDLFVPGLDR